MKLSLVFELLLIFVLLAFAASRVIESKKPIISKKVINHKPTKNSSNNRQDVNKYCSCSTKLCNCCREFNIPVVSLQGPGCASLQYLQGDRLAISMSFGERVLTNTTVSGKKPKPVCMPLPGGVSKFCGRVYNIAREGEDFKACLGLELRALKDVEASLRVSCFRFGPNGLKTEAAQPLPVVSVPKPVVVKEEEEDEDDDDEDEYEDEYDFDDDYENDADSGDYASFGVFDDDFVGNLFGGGGTEYIVEVEKPVKPTKPPPARRNTRKPARPVTKAEPKPIKKVTPKPVKAKTTQKRKVSSTTVAPTTIIVTSTSKQELPNVTPNTISSIKSNIETSSETVPSPSHESIAVVTAMLQNIPGDTSQVPSVNIKPVKGNSDDSSIQSTLIPNIVNTNSVTFKPISISTITEISQKVDTTTLVEKLNTESYAALTADDDDDDDESTETVENYILKNDSIKDDDDDDEDDDDDDDDDSDEDAIDSLTDPIAAVVEEVIGTEQKNVTKPKTETKKEVKVENNKTPASVLDDIVEGVVETITGTEVTSSTTTKKAKKTNKVKKQTEEDDDDDDDDDDDSFEDSEESAEDDDDDDDEDEARKINVPLRYSSRQSKDMRLNKLF